MVLILTPRCPYGVPCCARDALVQLFKRSRHCERLLWAWSMYGVGIGQVNIRCRPARLLLDSAQLENQPASLSGIICTLSLYGSCQTRFFSPTQITVHAAHYSLVEREQGEGISWRCGVGQSWVVGNARSWAAA